MEIEDYAVIGDTHTAALVSRDGSIDWLCFPRFDSGACFSAMLGDERHGRWLIAPRGEVRRSERRYRGDTLILEQEFTTDEGVVRITDCMPIRGERPDVVRIVEGISGNVRMRSNLRVRYDYGRIRPWVRSLDGRLRFVAGPDALVLSTPVELTVDDGTCTAEFTVSAGTRVPFVLTWYPSYRPAPPSPPADRAIEDTEAYWREWVNRCVLQGPYRDAVIRSLITLKALTYAPSGGIVAAATASLPEDIGGSRNWDYRYSWLRDATFTLECMLRAGYRDEAQSFRDWLLRAVAGDPSKLQIMYGVAGERRLDERIVEWLPGYEGSRPVRLGNDAVNQLQLDVFGETVEMLFQARRMGLPQDPDAWRFERELLSFLETKWCEPDEGIWEVRAGRREFVHSKVMSWVAFDRAVKAVERFGANGPVDRWRAIRDRIHSEVCDRGWNQRIGSFVQSYGSDLVDASLLLIPVVGFLPSDDHRVLGTIAAIERELMSDGLLLRYPARAHGTVDGVSGSEGTFLACSFWMVDALTLSGRRDDARNMFERLLDIRNDVGLLAEEYDTRRKRLVGNFPQAFSHVGLVNSAANLTERHGPATHRQLS